MLTWLWRLQSDRGGQHAEAGVLMATLLLLGAAVTVGSVPQLSTAVADQWTCHISDRGSSRCEGAATRSEVKAGKGFTAKTFDSRTTATPAGYTDPAESHGPRIGVIGNGQVIDVIGEPRPIAARSCTRDNCIDELGTYYECRSQLSLDASIGVVPPVCSSTITDATPLICTDEGLSVSTDTCKGPGGIFHCSNPEANGNRQCTEADNDADAHVPGGIPVSCGEAFDEDGSATCMGSNGTLYQCPGITEDNNGQCLDGGRNIEPLSLTDCVPIVSHSAASTVNGGGPDRASFENGTKDRVVRCTYTPATCNPAPTDGSSCSDQAVSVRCLVDSPSEAHPEYQHCQSLGEVVPDGQSLQTVCVDETSSGCDAAATLSASGRPPGLVEAQVGPISVQLDPDTEAVVVVDGVPTSMNMEELTVYCEANGPTCDSLAADSADAAEDTFTHYWASIGVCTLGADCDAFVAGLAATASGSGQASATGRRPLQAGDPRGLALRVTATVGFGVGTVYALTKASANGIKEAAGVAVMPVLGTAGFILDAIRSEARATDTTMSAASRAAAVAGASQLVEWAGEVVGVAMGAGIVASDWAGAGLDRLTAGGRQFMDRAQELIRGRVAEGGAAVAGNNNV